MKFNVTVYNPVGEIASKATVEMTEAEAARVQREAHVNGVRCEVVKTPLTALTAAHLLDVVGRAHSVIVESEGADEHEELLGELDAITTLLRNEIGASHMGTGADVVILERGDA